MRIHHTLISDEDDDVGEEGKRTFIRYWQVLQRSTSVSRLLMFHNHLPSSLSP